MSQQKDSNQGEALDEPVGEPVDETTLESSSPADSAPEAPADPVVLDESGDTATADSADTVALGKSGDAPAKVRKARESAAAATSSDPSGAGSAAPVSTPRQIVTIASIALLVVAAVAAAWFGGSWIVGGLMRDKPRAEARDAALAAAQQAAINITSMNLSDIDGSLALARSSMTGDLLDASTKNDAQIKKTATDSNVNTTSKVVGGAITELNSERDQAGALVVLEVTESGAGKPASRLRYTWSLDVVLKDGVWKADQVQQVADPVTIGSAAPAQQAPADPTTQPAPQPGN
ncbi:hypothetical protein OHB26_14735 [Nocardia sp. NBC_01503]|uniref:hypothetical protein n=1 Tax=Nocardia sp. NBC_01503 TaxID=2975997 RepID=UPI002E7AF94A|nr:hypothetical protein [Nocardia sp. NBC_01503]WTL35332.1 hypothetical protein OHB26_14735 [Nocardia sp. NBC_01503]